MSESDKRRLFLGLEVHAPWPKLPPSGRIIDENSRHVTLAFLGMQSLSKTIEQLPAISVPEIGPVGLFTKCLFLPHRHPRVVAWQIDWLSDFTTEKMAIPTLEREFLDHVTLCRSPFIAKQWHDSFTRLPLVATALHLYESTGSLHYVPRKSWHFTLPFEEIEHTADIAFVIRGKTLSELFVHAEGALCYHFPELTPYFFAQACLTSLEEVISLLNERIAIADSEIGSPLKAVSLHTHLTAHHNILEWEMIVDV